MNRSLRSALFFFVLGAVLIAMSLWNMVYLGFDHEVGDRVLNSSQAGLLMGAGGVLAVVAGVIEYRRRPRR